MTEDLKTTTITTTHYPAYQMPHLTGKPTQQLRTNTGTHLKRHQIRKHSLDENLIPQNVEQYYDSSEDDDFYPYATPATGLDSVHPSAGVSDNIDCHQEFPINQLKINSNSSDTANKQTPLPEFVGTGGEVGIFRVPCRAAVHPGRPSCLELRPHPLRETQVGRFLRTIACTETQLWAGMESGVRVWNFSDAAYEPGMGIGGRARRGDEDAAPFFESMNTSPTTCLVIYQGSKLVWSGHKDGKIRSWKMDQQPTDDCPFKEGLSWQAHRGHVLSTVISSYGVGRME